MYFSKWCYWSYKYFFINTPLPPEHTHTHNRVINKSSLRDIYRNNMQISDVQVLCKLRLKYPRNPHIGYLNINSLRNKIVDAREMIGSLIILW